MLRTDSFKKRATASRVNRQRRILEREAKRKAKREGLAQASLALPRRLRSVREAPAESIEMTANPLSTSEAHAAATRPVAATDSESESY